MLPSEGQDLVRFGCRRGDCRLHRHLVQYPAKVCFESILIRDPFVVGNCVEVKAAAHLIILLLAKIILRGVGTRISKKVTQSESLFFMHKELPRDFVPCRAVY